MTTIFLARSDFDTLIATIRSINQGTLDPNATPDNYLERHDELPEAEHPGSGFLIAVEDGLDASVQLMGTTLYFAPA